jgi:hypothetical protein
MFGEKLVNQRLQFGKPCRSRKQFLLFRRKVNSNFTFEQLLDFSLPRIQINLSALHSPIEPHAQRQRMLMLARKRDEVFIAQHVAIITDEGFRRASTVKDARAYIVLSRRSPPASHSRPSAG